MDPKGQNFTEAESATTPYHFKDINTINNSFNQRITDTPLRVRQNQMRASIQTETPEFKHLSIQQTNSHFGQHLMPQQSHLCNNMLNQKENPKLHEINAREETAFPFRKLKNKVETNQSLTPKQRLPTESFSQIQVQKSEFKKCHRKKLSTDLDCANDLQHRPSFKLLLQNRCKTTANKSQALGLVEIEDEGRKYFKKLKERPGKNQTESNMCKEIQRKEVTILGDGLIKCSNNDGKNARYKVKSGDRLENDQLYFCSRCTIPLVQQGFILQEINCNQTQSKPSIKQPCIGIRAKAIDKIRQKRMDSLKMLQELKANQRRNLNEVDSFYGDLINMLSRLRDEDKQTIQQDYLQIEKQLNRKLLQIDSIIELIDLNKVDCSSDLIQNLIKDNYLYPRKTVFVKRDAKDNFIRRFKCELRPDLSSFQGQGIAQVFEQEQKAQRPYEGWQRYQP